jgi:type VI secretion system secreted protein VgrG
MRLDANTTWFNITTQSGNFAVYEFSGLEVVGKPYEFTIELVSRNANEDIDALLGTPASLSIVDRSGKARIVHGLIARMQLLHTANTFTHYQCLLVPRLWFLTQITDHRIFQNLSVVEIIQKILLEQGFRAEESSFKLFYKYEQREYCVQYRESYLYFISRLCEEEGIYFYFEHTKDSHCLCFCDREGGPPIPGESNLRFYPGSGHSADTAVINYLKLHRDINSNASMYKEWNFQKPKLDLTVKERESDVEKAPVPPGMLLEQYQYPHLYNLRDKGNRYVKLQLDRQLTLTKWIDCQSDVSRYLPGHVFSIHEHPRDDINAQWWIVMVYHEGKQPGVLEHESPDGRGLDYQSAVQAIPGRTRFIPALAHPKERIDGIQTAIVTGPEGEEIYPDKYGRVKVQFFWDREGKWDEKTTCWIRVSQGWAGGQYGSMAIPRIGHEVVVSFLEGNPDRPLITGRVYHELNMPPYELPANKTRTVLRSLSSPKGERYNELQLEDKQGEELIFVHAARDMELDVSEDYREVIGSTRHETTRKESRQHFREDVHVVVDGARRTLVQGVDHHTLKNSRHTDIAQSELLETGREIHLKAGRKVVIEAGVELTIKAAGHFLKIDPGGVTVNGQLIRLNSGGSAGNGSGQNAEMPLSPDGISYEGNPKVTAPPRQVMALRRAAIAGKPFCALCGEDI